MTTDLDRLWTLHGLDEDIAAIDAELAKVPEQRQILTRKVAEAKARLDANHAAAAALVKQRRDAEREIEAADALEKKYLGQQGAVKTNAEFQALTHEISGARAKRSDLETRVLMVMDDEEKTATARPALERELTAAESDLAAREVVLSADEADASRRRGALEARRDANVAALERDARQRYERAHQARGGRAVVPILKGACGGCYRTLPPQALMEAKKRDRLLTCDGCGRLLVLPPGAPA